MVKIIGVRFQSGSKLYFFDPGEAQPSMYDRVLVETARGFTLGEVMMESHMVDEKTIISPLKPIVRMATPEDMEREKDNKRREKDAYRICQEKIEEHKLDMKLVRAEIGLDSSKILFYFTANGRVDFRALVKDLAGIFKTRIELRQIGVRDEARLIGGLGPCGLPICCDTFLADFEPVSIKMAKEQKLSLNPTKISGVCGRLMCCLKYEEDQYENTRKRMPKIGREIMTADGPAQVADVNVIKETVTCRLNHGDSFELKEYSLDDLVATGAAKPYVPEDPWHRETEPIEETEDLLEADEEPDTEELEPELAELDDGLSLAEESEEEIVLEEEMEERLNSRSQKRNKRERTLHRRNKRGKPEKKSENKGDGAKSEKKNESQKYDGQDKPAQNREETPVTKLEPAVTKAEPDSKPRPAAAKPKMAVAPNPVPQPVPKLRQESVPVPAPQPAGKPEPASRTPKANAWRAALEKAMAAAEHKDG